MASGESCVLKVALTDLRVPRSSAVIVRIDSGETAKLMSNTTLPLMPGGRSGTTRVPRYSFCCAWSASPWNTGISSVFWLSCDVQIEYVFLCGSEVLRSTTFLNRPPGRPTPMLMGSTSTSTIPPMSPDCMECAAFAFEGDPVLLVEPGQEVLHERPVEVDAAEERVSAGGNHLVDVSVQLEDAGVEGTAAEVVDHHPLLERPALREGDRRRGRLVDDALHVEPRQGASGTDGLALVVVVVGGHGDHRPLGLGAEPPLGQ